MNRASTKVLLGVAMLFAACEGQAPAPPVPAGPPPKLPPALEPLVPGAEPPIAVHCDPDIVAVSRPGSRQRMIAHTSTNSQLFDVQKGPIGPPIQDAGYLTQMAPQGPWLATATSDTDLALSLWSTTTGEVAKLPVSNGVLRVVGEESRVWAVFGTPEGDRFLIHEAGKTVVHPLSVKPWGGLVAANGAVWFSTKDCTLQRMGASGEVECVLEEGATKPKSTPIALGGRWLLLRTARNNSLIYDAKTGALEKFPGCQKPQVSDYVVSPPAAAVTCVESGSGGYWRPGHFEVVGPDAHARGKRLSERQRFLRVQRVLSGPDGPGMRYFDARDNKVVWTMLPLDDATFDGYAYSMGKAIDANEQLMRRLDLGNCRSVWMPIDVHGHHALVTCSTVVRGEELRQARARPRTIDSCRMFEEPQRLQEIRLVNLRSGEVHKVTGAKPIALTDSGLLALRGSGNNLLETDGAQIILQPYPKQGRFVEPVEMPTRRPD